MQYYTKRLIYEVVVVKWPLGIGMFLNFTAFENYLNRYRYLIYCKCLSKLKYQNLLINIDMLLVELDCSLYSYIKHTLNTNTISQYLIPKIIILIKKKKLSNIKKNYIDLIIYYVYVEKISK